MSFAVYNVFSYDDMGLIPLLVKTCVWVISVNSHAGPNHTISLWLKEQDKEFEKMWKLVRFDLQILPLIPQCKQLQKVSISFEWQQGNYILVQLILWKKQKPKDNLQSCKDSFKYVKLHDY